MNKKGVTLTECIVVAIMIGFVSFIILPTWIMSAGNSASKICLNNLRKTGKGLTMYLDDYGGYYPYRDGPENLENHRSSWAIVLQPYAGLDEMGPPARDGSPFQCPSRELSVSSDTPWRPDYAFNIHWGLLNKNLADEPSDTAIIADSDGPKRANRWHMRQTVLDDLETARKRHAGAVNVLFMDGHVAPWEDEFPRSASGSFWRRPEDN